VRLKGLLEEREEELRVISEELVRVNGERVESVRDLDICQERLDLVTKEARLNLMKLHGEKRESEQLLQRYIKENLESQEKDATLTKLQSRISDFEEKFLRLDQLQHEQSKKSKVFGIESAYN
jgi:hypothetical protein